MKDFFYILYKSIFKTIDHDGVEHAGYMSFMVLFSLFPFLVFFFAFTSFIGASGLGSEFLEALIDNLPEDAVSAIAPRIREIVRRPPESLMTIAILSAVWTASSFVEALRTILNKIYEVSTAPTYLWRRFLSIIQFLTVSIAITFILFLFVLIPTALNEIPSYVELVEKLHPIWGILRKITLFVCLFLTVAFLYYILPNVKLYFADVVPGAIITVVLWFISGSLLSKYLSLYANTSVIYGSIGGIIATLFFFFVINMLFIYGAEFNHFYKYYKKSTNSSES